MTSLSARLGKCLLVTSLVSAPLFAGAEVIFEENFDDQPDWHSAMHSTDRTQLEDTHVIPRGWSAVRQDPVWAPSVGHPDRHESIEILGSNESKARGGQGKSYVSWRDSHDPGWNRWNSESILAKHFPGGFEEIYVKLWIRFSSDWTSAGSSKLFRISSWDEVESIFGYGGDRYNAPVMFWDYSAGTNNVRNKISYRGHPQNTNYMMRNPEPVDLPRSATNSDLSLNFDDNIRDLSGDGVGDNDVFLLNRLSGEVISGVVSHDEVYGSDWNKVEFYVRMNSSPGAMDGVLKQWINDQLVFSNSSMPWQGYESGGGRRWNVVAIGGNDYFQEYPNDARHEEWYSIDDIEIWSSLPEFRQSDSSPPAPPVNLLVD